jgi:hypothetical protein
VNDPTLQRSSNMDQCPAADCDSTEVFVVCCPFLCTPGRLTVCCTARQACFFQMTGHKSLNLIFVCCQCGHKYLQETEEEANQSAGGGDAGGGDAGGN